MCLNIVDLQIHVSGSRLSNYTDMSDLIKIKEITWTLGFIYLFACKKKNTVTICTIKYTYNIKLIKLHKSIKVLVCIIILHARKWDRQYIPSNSTPVSFDITSIVYIMHTYRHEPMCRCRLH